MGTYFQKQAAADRLYKLACAARVIKRARAVQRLTKRAENSLQDSAESDMMGSNIASGTEYNELFGPTIDDYEPEPMNPRTQNANLPNSGGKPKVDKPVSIGGVTVKVNPKDHILALRTGSGSADSGSKDSKSKGSLLAALKALATNPYTIGGTAGSLAGSGIGALLAPKDKRLLYALLGSGIGTGLGVGGAAGYNALKKVK